MRNLMHKNAKDEHFLSTFAPKLEKFKRIGIFRIIYGIISVVKRPFYDN